MTLMKLRRFLFRRLRKDERGQGLVELAIIMPVFLLMVLGMIDLARAWNAKQVITDAAREAARRGVVDNPVVSEAYVVSVAEQAITNAGYDPATATISTSGVDDPTDTPLQVDISMPYTFNFMSLFMGSAGTITLETRIVMRNE